MNKCIKQVIRGWQNFTFQERWNLNAPKYQEKVSSAVLRILSNEWFGIANLQISGFAVERLPRNGEQRTYQVRFAGGFHDLIDDNDFCPVLYMLELTKRVYDLGQPDNDDMLAGFLARAFRSLTSFLKEPAFAEDLRECLLARGISHEISMSQEEDAVHHTDVKAVVNGKVFRFWIYQCSDNGIPHDIDRVSGRRGELPEGIHVLCPLHTSEAIELGTLESRCSRYKLKLVKWKEQLGAKINKNTKAYRDLEDKISTKEKEVFELKSRMHNIYQNTRVDIINGFFLYPKHYVEIIATKILSSDLSADEYQRIHDMMEAPRRYVSELNFFKK
jgi:hypothetical protein